MKFLTEPAGGWAYKMLAALPVITEGLSSKDLGVNYRLYDGLRKWFIMEAVLYELRIRARHRLGTAQAPPVGAVPTDFYLVPDMIKPARRHAARAYQYAQALNELGLAEPDQAMVQ